VGAFLPCGISLREGASAGETIVTVQNPEMISNTFGVAGLEAPAGQAVKRLSAALSAVGTPV
jgi:hypothetical protein